MAPGGDVAGLAAPPAPLVTVIVATFNSRQTLACALDSVRRQTCRDFEVQVVGDACTDGSETVVAALDDPRFHWINLPRNTGSQSLPNNEGLRRACGHYVAYLGHDDLWFPWHLEVLLDLARREGAAFVHGIGVLLEPHGVFASGPPRRGASYRGHFVPPTNWLVERALLERVGRWRSLAELGWPADVDVIDRIAATAPRIGYAQRLTTIKFPSAAWRAYAPDAPRPQIAMHQQMIDDAGTLAAHLLCDIAAEHARATFPTWAPPPALLWRDAAVRARAALGATLRNAQTVPILGSLLRWRYQRLRRRAGVRRGLFPQ
ncbi:MAG: glycosyltransferase family A protein [Vicinamibacteraceae bacterium]